MKRVIYVFLCIVLVSCTSVKYVTESKAGALAEIAKALPEYNSDHSVFWDYIIETNPTYRDYLQDNGKLTRKSRAEFQEKTRFRKLRLRPGEVEFSEDFLESLVGTPYTNYVMAIVIQENSEDEAFVTPDGVVRISANLLDDYPQGSLGIVAHEIAHYVLKHSEVNYIVKKKAERKARNQTNLVGALAAIGATAGSIAAYDAGIEVKQGEPSPTDYLSHTATNIALASKAEFYDTAERVNLSYSRDQELEADMIACMFMKWIGVDVSTYIDALEDIHLKGDYDYKASMYDTHPLYKLRIDMMEKYFLKENDTEPSPTDLQSNKKIRKEPQSEYYKKREQAYKGRVR